MRPAPFPIHYCRAEIRDRLKLRQYGVGSGNFDRIEWSVSTIGTRFECSSHNMLGINVLHASLILILEESTESISRYNISNVSLLIVIYSILVYLINF